jgi:hypothetical protein
MSSQPHTVLPWVVRRTRLPLLSLRAWTAGRTSKLTVHERAPVRSFDPAELDGYNANDPELVASRLLDPLLARRNSFPLDWKGAWRLDTPSAWRAEAWPVNSATFRCDERRVHLYRDGDACQRPRAACGDGGADRASDAIISILLYIMYIIGTQGLRASNSQSPGYRRAVGSLITGVPESPRKISARALSVRGRGVRSRGERPPTRGAPIQGDDPRCSTWFP